MDIVAKSGVWFNSAEIAGSFYCDKASMEGTVSLVNGRVGGTFSSLGCKAKGMVTLYGAEVERDFDCSGSRLSNANGSALLVDAAQIKGSVRLSQIFDSEKKMAGECFEAEGVVSLKLTRIGGDLDCTGGQFKALNGTCAISANALFVGGCVYHPPAKIQGSINLSGARTRELADRGFVGESGPAITYFPVTVEPVPGTNSSAKTAKQVDNGLQCEIVLDGFFYERINTNSCLDWKARKGWLERQPKNHLCEHFRHQPFDHLTGVLRAMGLADDARKIAILKQRCLTGSMAPSFNRLYPAAFVRYPHWLWRKILSLFLTYGYQPGKGLVIAIVMAGIFGWFYDKAEQAGAIVKHEGKEQLALKTDPNAQQGEARFHPYVYSLDVMLPGTGTSPWTVSTQPVTGSCTSWTGWICRTCCAACPNSYTPPATARNSRCALTP